MNIRTNINKVMFSIIIGIVICGTTTPTNATTMCITNDNTSIILDPSIEGTGYTRDDATMTWTVTFDYGTVSGIATCNSTSGTLKRAYPSYNFDNDHAGSTGIYCWCRMTYPVRSAWVSWYEFSSKATCASLCARRCGDYLQKDHLDYRESVYNSAGK